MTKFSADVITVILVTVLVCGEKCYSLLEYEFATDIRHDIQELNDKVMEKPPNKWKRYKENIQHGFAHNMQVGQNPSAANLLTRLKTAAHPKKIFPNNLGREHPMHQERIVRQAYPGTHPTLYPSLPTPSNNYRYQPYNYPNSIQPTQIPPPYNPQWRPDTHSNSSQPGYPGYNNYNSHGNQSPYNPTYNYYPTPPAPVAPRPPNNNPFAPTYPNNYNNSGPQNMPGYQPYPSQRPTNNFYPGYPSSNGFGKNISVYNPSPRPPYRPPYTNTQRTSNYYPTPFNPYNNSQHGFPNYRPGGVSSNTSNINYPGYRNGPMPNDPYTPFNNGPTQRPSVYNPTPFPGTYQTNYSTHSYGQPTYPGQNFTRPNQGQGYYSYGQTNQNVSNHGPSGQTNGQLPGMFNSQYPYSGNSTTYRVANHYTPSIPSQPPRNNYGGNNPPYSPNPTHDPTRVDPFRFSY